ncbi:uncharacterized protein E0L32_007109 [Thyridium curvatum]|uniref:Uncharacterized protein n=1 Tax=Thyridium curvatum TaxID=1093900 RepID=A0A507AWY3_9PEZI|nr:uncharacterized protein E0L32_007109 [Thyridium curvatum]TPX12223.1 hypothetical protein E0L32_007109 [Thyridium curvatum]
MINATKTPPDNFFKNETTRQTSTESTVSGCQKQPRSTAPPNSASEQGADPGILPCVGVVAVKPPQARRPLQLRVLPLQVRDLGLHALHALRRRQAELVHYLDQAGQAQHDDQGGDLARDAVRQQVHDEADDDDGRVEAVEPRGEIPATRLQGIMQ